MYWQVVMKRLGMRISWIQQNSANSWHNLMLLLRGTWVCSKCLVVSLCNVFWSSNKMNYNSELGLFITFCHPLTGTLHGLAAVFVWWQYYGYLNMWSVVWYILLYYSYIFFIIKNVHWKFECVICLFLSFIHENGICKRYSDLYPSPWILHWVMQLCDFVMKYRIQRTSVYM